VKKKLCLLTGASRGIGAGILSALAQLDEPVEVIAIAKRAESVATIRQQMRAQSLEGHAFSVDVTSEQSVSELFKTIATKYERGIDWLINNAGVTHDNLLLRMKESDWDSVIETNMTAVFRLCRLALPYMIKSRSGRIVNISSVIASTGNPGQANYAASKAGMEAMTKSLAREVARRGITANCVAPGFIETDMTSRLSEKQRQSVIESIPMRRVGSAAEVAHAVVFLLSEKAAYITGSCVHVNGGLVML
tara:strand:- start:247 stop:993 length:747 start_codon:yes stop_codon:yes gene_type:complete